MADLIEILGAIAASVEHARQIADQNTINVAMGYQQDPLLRGMSVPRFRLPEVIVDLPVIIDSYVPGQPEETAAPKDIVKSTRQFIEKRVAELGIEVTPEMLDSFSKNLTEKISAPKAFGPSVGQREEIARLGVQTFKETSSTKAKPIKEEAFSQIAAEIHEHILQSSISKPAIPPKLNVTAETDQVKARASSETVVRLQIRLREEGMEWNEVKTVEGTTKMKLTPE